MTYSNQSTGVDPKGKSVPLPVSGPAALTSTPLAANATYTTGWLPCDRYKAMLYAIQSDVPSATMGVTIEYSTDGINPSAGGISRSYTQAPALFQVSLTPKPNFVRLTYKNGATAQTSNFILVVLSDTVFQGTMSSLNAPATGTNLATVVKGPIEAPDSTGTYAQVERTDGALNVNVTNFSASNSSTTNNAGLVPSGAIPANQATTILNANANRKGATISSISGTVFVEEGAGASATNWVFRLVTNGSYEINPDWKGVVTVFSTASATITVNERV